MMHRKMHQYFITVPGGAWPGLFHAGAGILNLIIFIQNQYG
jgi:hypothetical protein